MITRNWVKHIGPALSILASFGAIAVLLRVQGRLWLCACGRIQFWSGDICSSDNSQHFLDPYSFTHVLHGFAFFWLILWLARRVQPGWQLAIAVGAEAAWEVFENSSFVIDRYRTATAALGYTGDTVVNSLGDLACAMIGFLIVRQVGIRWSLILLWQTSLLLHRSTVPALR